VPSTHAARNAASSGAPLSACVASGVLAINRSHGGAIEDCARALREVVNAADRGDGNLDRAADRLLADYKARGERLAGFGHVLHTADPRTAKLFALAREAGVAARHVSACEALAAGLERQSGRKLPINVDGAIAAVLLELGFEEEVMNGLFMISRLPGLIAHAREEMLRERPLRPIAPNAAQYDGPPPRSP
jgi:citrate synthase